jgi:hypothetical protein
MKTQFMYFSECKSFEEAKSVYRELAMKYHPDRGGDTEIMKQINYEWELMCECPFFEEFNEAMKETALYPEIINQLLNLPLRVELCGDWLWISGNTYPYRKALSYIGCIFSGKKKMWYYRDEEYKKPSKITLSIEEIRLKFGSKIINQGKFDQFNLLG